ncbi:hypothetical protein [Vibrio phage CAU_VPP01]|nr:hypothetical protein [Vibrio phage CAU_VPP01]
MLVLSKAIVILSALFILAGIGFFCIYIITNLDTWAKTRLVRRSRIKSLDSIVCSGCIVLQTVSAGLFLFACGQGVTMIQYVQTSNFIEVVRSLFS